MEYRFAGKERRLSLGVYPAVSLKSARAKRDEMRLLHAMGTEAANVHLGNRTRTKAVLADLRRRKGRWLRSAARLMAKALEHDWKEYR